MFSLLTALIHSPRWTVSFSGPVSKKPLLFPSFLVLIAERLLAIIRNTRTAPATTQFIDTGCMCTQSLQSCPTLCDPMEYSLPGSSVHGILQQEYWNGCHILLQEIFPTQGANPRLLCLKHWKRIVYPLTDTVKQAQNGCPYVEGKSKWSQCCSKWARSYCRRAAHACLSLNEIWPSDYLPSQQRHPDRNSCAHCSLTQKYPMIPSGQLLPDLRQSQFSMGNFNDLMALCFINPWLWLFLRTPFWFYLNLGFSGGTSGKELLANAGDTRDLGWISGSGRSPGERNATHTTILAWRIPWTEEPGGLQSIDHKKSSDWACTRLQNCNS